jgi:predicted nucleic acid-binding protein
MLLCRMIPGRPRPKNFSPRGGLISVQVLNEFVSVARRKFRIGYRDIARLTHATKEVCALPRSLTHQTHGSALKLAQRYHFNFYDCLIVASALESGCRTLYTEDLQHHQQIEGLQVINPFLAAPTN